MKIKESSDYIYEDTQFITVVGKSQYDCLKKIVKMMKSGIIWKSIDSSISLTYCVNETPPVWEASFVGVMSMGAEEE